MKMTSSIIFNAIIIDDEQRARDVLSELIKAYCPQIRIVATCVNVPDAVVKINQLEPDVVFCDIEMPDYNGFELLSFFKHVNFELIFVTAYSDYALRAFEVSAVDYILKPVEIEKLEKAVEKLDPKIREKQPMQERLDTLKANFEHAEIKKIALPNNDGITFIDIDKIIMISADGSYADLHLVGGQKVVVSKKLRYFEEALEGKRNFIRTHRSCVININYIKSYVRSDQIIVMENQLVASLARDKKAMFESFIKKIKI